MDRALFTLGGLLGALAVSAGAFGAHALRQRLSADMLAIFETAVRYHLIHALALVVTASLHARWPDGATLAGWLFVAGTLLFSGSLYLLSLTGVRTWGAVAPLGGLALMAGWLVLAWAAWRGA